MRKCLYGACVTFDCCLRLPKKSSDHDVVGSKTATGRQKGDFAPATVWREAVILALTQRFMDVSEKKLHTETWNSDLADYSYCQDLPSLDNTDEHIFIPPNKIMSRAATSHERQLSSTTKTSRSRHEYENDMSHSLSPPVDSETCMHERRSQRRFSYSAMWCQNKRPAGMCTHPYGMSLMMIRFYATLEPCPHPGRWEIRGPRS